MDKVTSKAQKSKSKNNIGIVETYVSPARKKLTQQSIRQFKIEIDHEIAKCLDTLDRQGLKFLKQTLKTSNLFNSTNFQVDGQNAKYSSQNSKINLNKPENAKIPTQMLGKYYASMKDEIAQTQNSKKKISPKKKNKQQNLNLHQQIREVNKQQSHISEIKPQKEPNLSKVQKDSMVRQSEKQQSQPTKPLNKNHRSNSSVKFNKAKQTHQVQELQKFKEKKYESAQTKSTTQIKEKQVTNSGSRVVKKTIIENKKTNQKISLGQKLNKKMEELHISKVGPTIKGANPTTKYKNTGTNKNPSKSNEVQGMPQQTIQEQIAEGIQNEVVSDEQNLQNIRQSIVSQSIVQQSSILQPESAHVFVKISQKINPLKSIGKNKSFQTPVVQLSKNHKIEQLKEQSERLQVFESKLTSNQSSSMNNQENDVEKLSMSIQVDNFELEKNSFQNSLNKEKFIEMSHIVDKINKLSPHKLMEIQKYIDFIQKTPVQGNQSEEIILNQNETNYQADSCFLYPEKTSLIKNKSQAFDKNRIDKQQKHQRPLTKLENDDHFIEKESIINQTNSKPPVSFHRNDSRKGNRQKKQKASMIFGSNSKSSSRSRIKIDPDLEEEREKPKESHFKAESYVLTQSPYIKIKSNSKSDIKCSQILLKEQSPIKMQKIDYNQPVKNINLPSETNADMKSSKMNLSKIQMFQKSQKNIQLQTQSLSPSVQLKEQKELSNNQSRLRISVKDESKLKDTSLNIEYTEVKMLNINKRSMVRQVQQARTKLKFKILSNRGHPSVFGLTGIQLFTIDNRQVLLTEKQLGLNSSSTSKLLSLFNENHQSSKDENFYQSALNKNQIIVELDKENDKIGGILIFNFNKSSLESDKQVDQLQIYHNDTKMWKGSINPGSYNQTLDYSTKIQFIPNFKFPTFQMINKSFTHLAKEGALTEKLTKFNDDQKHQIKISPLRKDQEDNKKVQQTKIQRRRNNTESSSKNFQLSDSRQNFKAWNSKNEEKVNNFKIYNPSNIQSISKTQRRSNYDQFDSMLNGLEQNIQREKSQSKIATILPASNYFQNGHDKNNSKIRNTQNAKTLSKEKSQKGEIIVRKPQQKTTSQEIEDFVNASIFKDKSRPSFNPSFNESSSPSQKYKFETSKQSKVEQNVENKNKDINIDDFLGELEDVMKSKDGTRKNKQDSKQIQIPNNPSGNMIQLEILQNWGHQAYVGIHSIQFFDNQGNIIFPTKIQSNKNHQNINLTQTLNNKKIMNRDEKIQIKLGFDKKSITTLFFSFLSNQTFCLIRIWNYNGHRVHSNIGIKSCIIKINGKQVFIGDIKRNESTPQNFHKNFDPILFTNDPKIMNKIREKDWLTELKNKSKQEKELFKSTLINFNRPKTRNSENKNSSKENHEISSKKIQKEIKFPKRQCWQYEPPEMPEGNFLVLLLHDTWGDQNFIGLNGIQIFDSQGKILANDNIRKIKSFPNSTGEKNDKRVVQNLINGNNLSSIDSNIWLSTYQSDIEKIETGKPNMIIIELSKKTKISGINIFNYSKTPQRGVRQIEIQLNNMTAFRGYVKMFDEKSEQNCFHTTINFTKNVELLAKMNYELYHEDNIDQNVMHVNERKLIKT